MRPTSAGLAKLYPRPPNSCLVMTMATNAPTTAIHSGILTGMLSARMMPVTTAERSPAVLGLCSSTSYRYSNATQAKAVTATSSSARRPKISAEASTQGSRAMTT